MAGQEAEKIKLWCAYQERSHDETRKKLKKSGLSEAEADRLMVELISENYLNEERFARALAGGKFRMKRWGRIKIKHELIKHKVSEANIRTALQSIDDSDYRKTLKQLVQKKTMTLGTRALAAQKQSVYRYLIGKGFEPELVMAEINSNFNEHES